jgi:pimeloyl-ACP methyl ester carboxylesterase
VDELIVQRGSRRLFVSVRGTGPAFVFAHGLSGTHADTAWLARPASGFRLIAPDLYGRGASFPAREVDDHAFDEHAADVLSILDHLDVEQAVVGGTSFGAAVALAFAVRHPSRVRALILLASAFGSIDGALDEGDLGRYGVLGDRMASEGVCAVAESESDRVGSRRPVERWARHDEASLVAFMRAVPRNRPIEQLSDVGALTMPTLVVSGDDEIHRPELSTAYANALPDAVLIGASAPLSDAVGTFLDPFRNPSTDE